MNTWKVGKRILALALGVLLVSTTSMGDVNAAGTKVKSGSVSYLPDGTINFVTEYSYDMQGNLVRQAVTDGLGNLSSDTYYYYDESGRQTKGTLIVYYDGVATITDSAYLYDAAGNLAFIQNTDVTGALMSMVAYVYDAAGNQTQSITVGADGAVDLMVLNSYDAAGNKTGTQYYTGTCALMSSTSTTYNKAGNEKLAVSLQSNGEVGTTTEYKYDKHGRLKGMNVIVPEIPFCNYFVTYELDADGDWTKMINKNNAGTVTGSTEYFYTYI